MRFYANEDRQRWYATLRSAHLAERDTEEPVYRPSIRIHEYDVPTDKASVLALLHGAFDRCVRTGRVWTLTQRGGLKEITPSEPEEEP